MLVLLPPSEGKARPEAGAPVELGSLAFAERLTGSREAALDAYDPRLREAPAAEVHTGVLFKRLELPKLAAKTDGERRPVSHMAKAVRGDVARALLTAKRTPADPEGAAAVAEQAGFTVELADGNLDVIV